jgi:hypothetical protein
MEQLAYDLHALPTLGSFPLLGELAPAYLITDRGYDSDPPAVPRPSFRPGASAYNAARYAQRHPVERLFSRLKQFRRVATRYEKLDAHFLTFIHFGRNHALAA